MICHTFTPDENSISATGVCKKINAGQKGKGVYYKLYIQPESKEIYGFVLPGPNSELSYIHFGKT
jgi:hypothetical protein